MRKVLISLLLCIILFNTASKLYAQSLVGSWTFNDGTANDESGNNNHGTVNGATLTTDRFGNENSAYSFDGDDNIGMDYISEVNLPDGSISFWIKSSNDSRNTILSFCGTNSLARFSIEIGDGSTGYLNDELLTIITGSTNTSTVNRVGYTTTNRSELLDDNWHHVVVVAGNSYKVYIDGEEKVLTVGKGSSDGQFTDITGIDNFRIGSTNINGVGENVHLQGTIDDLKIFNYTLSEIEVQDLYSEEDPKQLIGSWNFNDGTANDVSGNNNHGTPTNVNFVNDRFGNAQSACEFDGTAIINTNDTSFDFDTGFSVSFWLKTTSTVGEQRWFFKNSASPDRSWFLSLNRNATGKFTFFSSEDGTNSKELHSTSSDYNDGNWHHVVLVFDGTNGVSKIYKDNVLDGQDLTAYNSINQNDVILSLSQTGNEGIGIIDDINIYNYAILETEIQELYSAPDPKQLVGSWTFNDGTANDESGNDNHGTVNGATLTTDRFGNENSAYSFDGVDDFIQVPDYSFENNDEWSISLWMNWQENTVNQDFIFLLGQENSGVHNILIKYGTSNRFGYRGNDAQYAVGVPDGLQNIYNTGWHHVVMCANSDSSLSYYIDGEYKESIITDTKFVLNGIGKAYNSSAYSFKGELDDVNLYNYTLSQTEIDDLYNVPNPKQLVGSWTFNDGTANDESGNNNDGTVNGATLTTDRFGNENSAYSFDGVDDYLILGDNAFDFAQGQDFSVSLWLNRDETQERFPGFITNGATDETTPGWALTYKNAYKSIDYYISDGTERLEKSNSSTYISGDSWNHIIFIADRDGEARCYLNGSLIDIMTMDISTVNSNLDNVIETFVGRWADKYFKGEIDDISIYNYILSDTEVQDLYNAENPKQLVGSWTFNDGTANDESGNNNDGTVNGATLTTDRFGNENSAYSFDGVDNYIKVLNSESLNFGTSDFTVSTWIKWDEATSEHDFILAKGSAGAIGYGLGIQTGGYYGAFIQAEGGVNQYYGYTPINADDWNLLTVVHDRDNKIKVYLNGSLANSGDYLEGNENSISTDYKLFIGSYGSDGRYFKGLMDDINIYNYALSESEVTELYNEEDPKQPVGFWSFNDGTANDESGNGNHGTPTNLTFVEDRFGNSQKACEFDETSIMELNDESFDFSNQFSISFWLKTTSTESGQRWFFKNSDIPNRSWFFSLNRNLTGQFTFFSSSTGSDYREFHSTSTNYNDGSWHHIVLVYDGNNTLTKIYKDNILDGQDNSALGEINLNDAILSISQIGNEGIGVIDDIGIYNYALSETEIQELYNTPDPVPDVLYAIRPGDWSDPTVWSLSENGDAANIVPGIKTKAVISGYEITISDNLETGNIELYSDPDAATSLLINGGNVVVYGKVILKKDDSLGTAELKVVGDGSLTSIETE